MLTDYTKQCIKTNSDKAFWHKYTDFYEPFFKVIQAEKERPVILEYGVFKGGSIRMYLESFRHPIIYGVDIVAERPTWPKGDDIHYFQVDQSNRGQIRDFLKKADQKFDLVIEDGGHRPDQQYYSLIETVDYMAPGSLYILEDIHTSLKGHPLNKYFGRIGERFPGNCYNVLTAILHLKQLMSLGKIAERDAEELLTRQFTGRALIPPPDRLRLFTLIEDISFFKRADLPLLCWSCGSHVFDYEAFKCVCGKLLMGAHDSMSAVLTLR